MPPMGEVPLLWGHFSGLTDLTALGGMLVAWRGGKGAPTTCSPTASESTVHWVTDIKLRDRFVAFFFLEGVQLGGNRSLEEPA